MKQHISKMWLCWVMLLLLTTSCYKEDAQILYSRQYVVPNLTALRDSVNKEFAALRLAITKIESREPVTHLAYTIVGGDTLGAHITFGNTRLFVPFGKDGLNGRDGKDGLNGRDGKDGQNGRDGKNGLNGRDGKDGLNGRDGKDGQNGRDGKDGLNGRDGKDGASSMVSMGENGNWFLNGQDTGKPWRGVQGDTPTMGIKQSGDGLFYWTIQWPGDSEAQYLLDDKGQKVRANALHGRDGQDGRDGQNGQNGRDGKDGKDGQNAKKPEVSISAHGTWVVDGNDTGVLARGDKGDTGAAGRDGKDGQNGRDGQPGQDGRPGQDGQPGQPGQDGHSPTVEIDNNGFWVIDGNNTNVQARGEKGDAGVPGQNGAPGIESPLKKVTEDVDNYYFDMEFSENGANIKQTLTFPKVKNPSKKPAETPLEFEYDHGTWSKDEVNRKYVWEIQGTFSTDPGAIVEWQVNGSEPQRLIADEQGRVTFTFRGEVDWTLTLLAWARNVKDNKLSSPSLVRELAPVVSPPPPPPSPEPDDDGED